MPGSAGPIFGPSHFSCARSRGGRYRISCGPSTDLAVGGIGNQQQRGARLVVSGQIVEVRFLKKDRDFGSVFVPGVAEDHHRPIDFRPQLRAARLIFRAGLAEARLVQASAQMQTASQARQNGVQKTSYLRAFAATGRVDARDAAERASRSSPRIPGRSARSWPRTSVAALPRGQSAAARGRSAQATSGRCRDSPTRTRSRNGVVA